MIPQLVAALRAVRTPRLFETERGYQGQLLTRLENALPALGVEREAIVEQEYQKRLHIHNITIRPDIIIHFPTPQGGNRRIGNSVVFELKRRAGPTKAQEDFGSLDTIIGALHYPLGVFVNIDSGRTQAAHYQGPYRDRIHFFAVRLVNGAVQVRHAFYTADGLVER